MKPPEKHRAYFELHDALRSAPGCVFCQLAGQVGHRYLENLFTEYVNDTSIRGDLGKAGGFCARHAQALQQFGDGLGASILCRDLLGVVDSSLASLGSARKLPRDFASWRDHRNCPACAAEQEAVLRHISILHRYLGDADMQDTLRSAPPFCMPHLITALEMIQDAPARPALIADQRAKLRTLIQELQEFCRKEDYRFRNEGSGREADAWIRALSMIGGTL
jgi:hypothetical protein